MDWLTALLHVGPHYLVFNPATQSCEYIIFHLQSRPVNQADSHHHHPHSPVEHHLVSRLSNRLVSRVVTQRTTNNTHNRIIFMSAVRTTISPAIGTPFNGRSRLVSRADSPRTSRQGNRPLNQADNHQLSQQYNLQPSHPCNRVDNHQVCLHGQPTNQLSGQPSLQPTPRSIFGILRNELQRRLYSS